MSQHPQRDPFAPDDLSDLWADAQRAERLHPQRPRMVAAKPAPPSKIIPKELFTLEEYWEARRTLCLIHADSQSLIGNFREYTHKRVPGCRRLVRVEDTPALIHGTEYISGWEHLGEAQRLQFEPVASTAVRELVLEDLVLSALGVHACRVEIRVHLSYGGIARVELRDHTRFSSPEGRMLLTLPANLNVLDCMSLESKIALRKELST